MKDNELFQIGEVSRLFHVSVSILRHYDKIGLLKPEYVDEETGYRYYSTRQFECLNTIRYLRALDLPLEQISGFLQNRDTDHIAELLRHQKEEVRRRMQELELIERKINNRLVQLEDAADSELDVIKIVKKPSRRVAAVKKKLTPRNYLDLEQSIRQLEAEEENTVVFLGKVGVGISAEHLKIRQYLPYDMVFVILDEEDQFRGETLLLEPETCVTIRFQGSHERAAGYYDKMLDYIEGQGYLVSGFSKELTMIDYGLTNDTSKFVTEIQIPVWKKEKL
ncbi:MAG: MerR family transcriptional regulator [Eubacteriales bacterium]|nr:MerR family transcriptional regulator [Eubacteriales bacterium]